MVRLSLSVIFLAALLVACGKGPDQADQDAKKAVQALALSPEDLVAVQNSAMTAGPSITGSIQPERRADLRAEVQAVVLQVLKENGDAVKRGDLLVRLDDTAIRDALASAQEAERVAGQAYDQAERQLSRLKTLRESGMASAQQLEDAEIRRNATQGDLSASKARTVQARQQMQRTESRAPFDGIVSERKVSAGDTAQVGKELLKVIDPNSMRFEGLVSADDINQIKVGQPVSFRVNGYGNQYFNGKVRRVNPAANATTRQGEVLVDFAGDSQPKLSGLYAEGRVEAASSKALMVPDASLVRDGDKTYAWRLAGDKLQKVSLSLGARDPRSGDYAVTAGLADGDQLIRVPSAALKDGQKAQLNKATAASAPASTSSSPALAATAAKG
jgi:RND family efflux transporter MFP subunit